MSDRLRIIYSDIAGINNMTGESEALGVKPPVRCVQSIGVDRNPIEQRIPLVLRWVAPFRFELRQLGLQGLDLGQGAREGHEGIEQA